MVVRSSSSGSESEGAAATDRLRLRLSVSVSASTANRQARRHSSNIGEGRERREERSGARVPGDSTNCASPVAFLAPAPEAWEAEKSLRHRELTDSDRDSQSRGPPLLLPSKNLN
jgi:hypothetical protein